MASCLARATPCDACGWLPRQWLARRVIDLLRSFEQGLREAGYVEGRNLALEYRWAEGRYARLPAMAAELVERRVAAIFCAALPAAVAAKQASATIPMVFVMGADPAKQGIVASLARPGGNLTGVTQLFGALGGKRLQLLHEMVPAAATFVLLSNPRNPNAENQLDEVRVAARVMGKRVEVLRAGDAAEIDTAFAGVARLGAGAMLVADDAMFFFQRKQVIALAARHAVPVMHFERSFVTDGGLVSYSPSGRESWRLAAGYLGRILNGAKPGDLPVLQPTAFELVINLKTAKALGVTIAPTLLARADELIE